MRVSSIDELNFSQDINLKKQAYTFIYAWNFDWRCSVVHHFDACFNLYMDCGTNRS